MCWMLYGSVRQAEQNQRFLDLCEEYGFCTQDAVIEKRDFVPRFPVGERIFRWTCEYCDCDTGIGVSPFFKQGQQEQVQAMLEFLRQLKQDRKCGVKHLFLLKHWVEQKKQQEIVELHVDDLDAQALQQLKEETYYQINLYPRYAG